MFVILLKGFFSVFLSRGGGFISLENLLFFAKTFPVSLGSFLLSNTLLTFLYTFLN